MKSLLILIPFIAYLLVIVTGQECDFSTRHEVRLSSTGLFTSPESGRVEICVCTNSSNSSCAWQTVSAGSPTTPMTWKNSIVVCRELGYEDVYSPILQNTVPSSHHADSSVVIYPTTFRCDGTESTLKDCTVGTSTASMTHAFDAYVNCQSNVMNNKVRLTGTTAGDRGVVQVYSASLSTWRTICPDFWDNTEANLLCQSLGFGSGSSITYSRNSFQGPNIENTPSIQLVSCSITEKVFSSCSLTSGTSCGTGALAGAICVSNNTSEGTVRLFSTSTTTTTYERVEVFYDGRWGTVCRLAWTDDDGDVACRELGGNVDQAVISTSTAFNSQSSLPIWVYSYSCSGDESTLSSCINTVFPVGYVASSCSHSTDAGLSCPIPDTEGGGLSGGAIAGIVIGSIVFVGIVGWFFGMSDQNKRKQAAAAAQRQAAAAAAQRRQVEAAAAAATQSSNATTTAPSSTSSSSTSSSSSSESTPNTYNVSTPSNPTLSQAPPPSYNEALQHLNVKDPPKYPDEEKTVPYPAGSSNDNPAYPSAPPGPSDNLQGYPPPTHTSGYGAGSTSTPYPPPPAGGNPYPPQPQSYMPGQSLPYPT